MTLTIHGIAKGVAAINTLHAASRWATNSIEEPEAIHPVASQIEVHSGDWQRTVPGNTIEVTETPADIAIAAG